MTNEGLTLKIERTRDSNTGRYSTQAYYQMPGFNLWLEVPYGRCESQATQEPAVQ